MKEIDKNYGMKEMRRATRMKEIGTSYGMKEIEKVQKEGKIEELNMKESSRTTRMTFDCSPTFEAHKIYISV